MRATHALCNHTELLQNTVFNSYLKDEECEGILQLFNMAAGLYSAVCVQGEAHTCAIKLTTKEMARWGFKLLAHVTMDARVVSQANAKLRNLTGYADHHTVMFQYGGHTRHDMHGKDLAYKLRFARIFGRPLHSQLKLHRSNNDCRFESSYNELVRGINFDLISYDSTSTASIAFSFL